MEQVVKAFVHVLDDLSPQQVIEGIRQHLKINDQFPTPKDIRNIALNIFVPNWAYYNWLVRKKQNGSQLDYLEDAYVQKCEELEKDKL